MSRDELERLRARLAERIGPPRGHGEDADPMEPLRRQVRHAVTGIDAYLTAVEAGNGTLVGLRERALDLWLGLERIVSERPDPSTDPGRVPAQPAPLE
ncbi:hypothetical protein [Kitasatospora sp. NPDC097691]|uniref:hypothetical protein n=1 Tax=Kitasatospora sp. NPDC097691 TaxID=3157231 RepID=UPI00332A18A6